MDNNIQKFYNNKININNIKKLSKKNSKKISKKLGKKTYKNIQNNQLKIYIKKITISKLSYYYHLEFDKFLVKVSNKPKDKKNKKILQIKNITYF